MKEGQNIKVVARLRPLNTIEMNQGGECCVNYNEKSITVTLGNSQDKNDFTFDRIFGPESAQVDVYDEVARPILESVMNGYNGTIFAYGQTSSGKTFTMEGPDNPNEESIGLIPRVMGELFEQINQSEEELIYIVKVSFLEIYNEKIQDLLDPNKTNLKIKEDRLRGIHVHNLTEVQVQSPEEMKKVMITGSNNRTIAATRMNERSSRSHSLFQIFLSVKNLKTDSSKMSKLYFVDLAGSEKIAKTNVTGQQLEEAKNINKSLTCLGMVINALTSEKKEHIPYRDSKLTRILMESLGGNAKTTLVVACSMCSYNDKETLSTLRFGARAKAIKNKPIVNAERSARELQVLLDIAEKKILDQDEIIKELMDRAEVEPKQLSDSQQLKKGGSSLQMLKQHKLVVNLQEEIEVLKTESDAIQMNMQSRIDEIYEKYIKEKQSNEKLKQQFQESIKMNQKYIYENEQIRTQLLENEQRLVELKRSVQNSQQDLKFFISNFNMKSQFISDTESTKDIFMLENYDKDIEERTFQSLVKLQETLKQFDQQIGSESLLDDEQSVRLTINQFQKRDKQKSDLEPISPKLIALLENENISFQTEEEESLITLNEDTCKITKQDIGEESEVEKLLALLSEKMEDSQSLYQIQDVMSRLRKQVVTEQNRADEFYQKMIAVKDRHELYMIKERKQIQQLKQLYQQKKKQQQQLIDDLTKQLEDLTDSYQSYQHNSDKQLNLLQTTNQQLLYALESQKSVSQMKSQDPLSREFQLECTVKQLMQERNELSGSLNQTRQHLDMVTQQKNSLAEQLIHLENQLKQQELQQQKQSIQGLGKAGLQGFKQKTAHSIKGWHQYLIPEDDDVRKALGLEIGRVTNVGVKVKQGRDHPRSIDGFEVKKTTIIISKYLRQISSNREMQRNMMIQVQSLIPGQSFQKNVDRAKEQIKKYSNLNKTVTSDQKMMQCIQSQYFQEFHERLIDECREFGIKSFFKQVFE